MLEKFKIEVLRLIARHDGKLTWYSIARSMTYEEFLPVIDRLGEILREYEQQGIIAKPDGDCFVLTEAGQNYLQKAVRRPQREAA